MRMSWPMSRDSGNPRPSAAPCARKAGARRWGYPGIVLDAYGGEVDGFLFSSGHLPAHWARLDAFEGEGYERVMAAAKLGDGTIVDTYVYALREPDRRPPGRRQPAMHRVTR